ncbi:sugar ABC transporter substrate-binding protein [Mesorhizobium sp. M7A.F.Ca.US.011.01.1.1]|uniref:sugar ABC transporter substrate-binding protein n=1 Tax=Mesorhizobium sp. M7A.F.Ca.US.011.01.1.1 TaxID=2496741 RepID=UPI000FCB86E3|nr:sugar ABC transporter substrate-binding protein [Mesorhizobium sp. M7A.F.Ca.US.011.01.1.1]RUX21847.1 sugar ABC transporter substrate-binding protein [Mesorhizobium sp. M7A.F.Ca.US.011.01.1.1]
MKINISVHLRRLSGIAAASVLACGLLATNAHAQSAEGRIILGVDETASEYWAEFLQGAKSVAKSVNREAVVLVANYQGQQLLTQLSAVYSSGCDKCSLVAIPSTNAFTKAILDRSARAGVKVVTIWNRPEELHPWDTQSATWVAHNSFDGVASGYIGGMAICKALSGKGKIAAIGGGSSSAVARQRLDGLKKAIAECPGLELVDVQYGEWQEIKAQSITRTWLAKYGDELKAIAAGNDAMASGAIAALREKGLNGKIFVTGSDGSAVAFDLIKKGDMLATVWQNPSLQGAVTAALAYAAAMGDIDPEKLPQAQRDFYMKQSAVDASNVDKFIELKKNAPSYDYADLKSKLWDTSEGQIPVGANNVR